MKTPIRAAGLAAVLALSITTSAIAHPGVYSVDSRVAKTAARQTITDDATGGSFKPSAGASAVMFDATTAQVLAALQSDPPIGYDNVTVGGPAGGPTRSPSAAARWQGPRSRRSCPIPRI